MAAAQRNETLARVCAVLARERLTSDGRAALTILRALWAERRWKRNDAPAQMLLALIGDLPVDGCPLNCGVTGTDCVARQLASEREIGKGPAPKRSSPHKRGRVATMVSCVTAHCSIGRKVRETLGDSEPAKAKAVKAPRAQDTASN